MAVQPKKPAGGAYGRFLAEKREEIKASLPAGHKITDVTKKAGELFKALSEADKKKYQEQYEKAAGEYKEAAETFKAGGGVIERKSKRGKDGKVKKVKDADAPKKPTGGAYGQFLAEKRKEIAASLPADHKITDVAKKAGELYKALSEAETQRYTAMFKTAQEKYEKAMAEYKATKGDAAAAASSGSEGASPAKAAGKAKAATPEKATGKARAKASPAAATGKAKAKAKASPKAAGKRARATEEEAKGVELDDAVLKKARTLGYETQLKNLAAREDVAKAGKSSAQLLDALKASSGLVNAAKRALVGA